LRNLGVTGPVGFFLHYALARAQRPSKACRIIAN